MLTSDDTRFLEIRQHVLLQIADIVEESATLLPQPALQVVASAVLAPASGAPASAAPAVVAPVRNPVGTDDARMARS